MNLPKSKSQTIFYWLSLATALITIVMLIPNWFSFQVASFGPNYEVGRETDIDRSFYNLEEQNYNLLEVDDFLKIAPDFVKMEENTWAATLGKVGMIGTLAAQALFILIGLITMRRTPPRGFLPGGLAILTGGGFLLVHSLFSSHIAQFQLAKEVQIVFECDIYPYLLLILGVATIVFGMINRQESRVYHRVKHPRPFVFPPENPEIV